MTQRVRVASPLLTVCAFAFRLIFGQKLGEGEFGLVMKGELVDASYKTVVAVKMLKEGHSDDEMINLFSEMEVMKRIGKHKNIINLIGCCTQNGKSDIRTDHGSPGLVHPPQARCT